MKKSILLNIVILIGLILCSCGMNKGVTSYNNVSSGKLLYAKQFEVEDHGDGIRLITIAGRDKYLYVPNGSNAPQQSEGDVKILRGDLSNIYVASSSSMDLFLAIGALDKVKMTSTESGNWTIPEIKSAVEDEKIEFVGKYSMPDYEYIVDSECDLVVENTMIEHTPEVREQLEALGIPVLTDYSSYEDDPLGRMEWIKLYGILTGKEEKAEEVFDDAVARYKKIEGEGSTGKKVAYFYITSSGLVSIRKPDDYIVQMIENAGGTYAFKNYEENDKSARPTTNIQMEVFYEMAKDADIIIYNGTIGGEIESMDALVEKSSLISDFKAFNNKEVWCTSADMFQHTAHIVDIAEDFFKVINDDESAVYMKKLE